MRIYQLKYLVDELQALKALGGSSYTKAEKLLHIEATTENIELCMKEIQHEINKQQLKNNK